MPTIFELLEFGTRFAEDRGESVTLFIFLHTSAGHIALVIWGKIEGENWCRAFNEKPPKGPQGLTSPSNERIVISSTYAFTTLALWMVLDLPLMYFETEISY